MMTRVLAIFGKTTDLMRVVHRRCIMRGTAASMLRMIVRFERVGSEA